MFTVTLTLDEGHRSFGPTIFWPWTGERIFFENPMGERRNIVDVVKAMGLREAAEDCLLASLVGYAFTNLG